MRPIESMRKSLEDSFEEALEDFYEGENAYEEGISFTSALKKTIEEHNHPETKDKDTAEETELGTTENGALGYKSAGSALLDIHFQVSSLRNASEEYICWLFDHAYCENRMLAVKWLFLVSDVRGGMGERRLFRVCMKHLAGKHPETALAVLSLIPEYSRWDNLFCVLGTEVDAAAVDMIRNQLSKDQENMAQGKTISLLAKWMPSANTSSEKTRFQAYMLMKSLGLSEKKYRRLLSSLRAYLGVLEGKMSRRAWSEIDYEGVPSRANLVYRDAFMRNDEERRSAYLKKLSEGKKEIHAGVLFPHDIVSCYTSKDGWRESIKKYDASLEFLWKALPDYVQGEESTICVADGSGSMMSSVGKTGVTCLDVANALAIYFAERCRGEFQNRYITFSQRPQMVDLSGAASLREKLEIALEHDECENTNIEKVFDLILETAVKNEMKQEEMPGNILILSDMEFDYAACNMDRWTKQKRVSRTLFEEISERYRARGYKLPRLIFWNICSRTGIVPIRENELGVALISGFTPAILKMVLTSSLDMDYRLPSPEEFLMAHLNSERYAPVEKALLTGA